MSSNDADLSALIYAAGRGTRMAPLTDKLPKPLIPVAGKALIDHSMDLLDNLPLRKKVVNTHYMSDKIHRHFEGKSVSFSNEAELLETGGGLKNALQILNTGRILTVNSDAVWKGPNPAKMLIDAWKDHMEALLLLVPSTQAVGHLGKGDFDLNKLGQVERGKQTIYSGMQITRGNAFEQIEEASFSTNVVWDQMLARRSIFGLLYTGQWCDVGQPQSIPIAEKMLRS